MATAAQLETQTSLLAIVDAAHEVESALLLRWLGDQKADANTQMQTVTLAIGKDPDNLETGVLETELDARDDTLVLPVRVVWQDRRTDPRATPRLLDLLKGDPRRPGLRRARKLLQQDPANAQCVQGAPATIGELRAQFAEQGGEPESRDAFARFVSGQASIALDIAERQMRGGRYKVPRRVADNIKRSKRFKDGVAELSERLGEPVEALEARAEEIFSELIARPRGFWQDIIAAFNRRVISMGYQPEFVVDEGRLKEIRDLVRQHPTALLWTHKTHIDGFAVFSMLFENDFPVPHLLGGVNMAFAGLGYAAKRSGAIFIRRSFQDDPLYKMILRQYIGYLLEKRFPVSWAFEGTRSRVGKLMPPRYGILKYVLEAADASDAKDLKVIPIALNYDLIRDVKDYVREQAGGVKQPESLRWFIGYLRGLRKPLGKIYIDFGDPIVINKSPAQDDSLGLKKIAFQVGVETNRVTPVTLTSLVSTILLGHAPRALTRLELGKEMVRYLRWARDRNIPLADELERDDLTAINRLADILGDHGLITRYDEGPDVVYTIVPEQHHEASYYRNTTIHHFIVKA
ncbi:MAG: 1-acyl-sn-glycerol-3-phosphate acyltransferase, partial [Pseudomonadota bacterium]